ncbi:hypothetical protein IQ03_01101 [Gemmobacter caeni]|uniref:Uncharacterized protein n=1 Tax=Gemmobacter caeni TaxID=589035 RepID=A0A2T6B8F8_9RHOB|nr:hypothetical protein [Gemmobacter caeni]PTX52312.1 hypothetical protein C8N34_10290 [Gemmobacter caeni]TWJ02684.1 hypothetical protein IQ03_01101 [Gemmobacter caeni]
MNSLVLPLVLMLAGASPAAASDYVCKPTLFGLCKTTYVGPATEAAAVRYVEDAKGAVETLLDQIPAAEEAHYSPKTGVLVLVSKKGDRVYNDGMRLAADLFIAKKLHLNQVVVMNAGRHFVIGSKRVIRDEGGYSRYFALKKKAVTETVTRTDS